MKLLKKRNGIWFIRISKSGTYQDLRSWLNTHMSVIMLMINLVVLILWYFSGAK